MSSESQHAFDGALSMIAGRAFSRPPDNSPPTSASISTNSLACLPEELILYVCENLDRNDIHALRLTCKELFLRTRPQFAAKHFETLRLMTTRDSLEIGTWFATNIKYNWAVKKLVLYMVTFMEEGKKHITAHPATDEEHAKTKLFYDNLHQLTTNMQDFIREKIDNDNVHRRRVVPKGVQAANQHERDKTHYDKSIRRERRRRYGTYRNDQYRMRKRGEDIGLLVDILKNLPALESIALVVDQVHPEPNQDRPFGSKKIKKDIGMEPQTIQIVVEGSSRTSREQYKTRELTAYSTHAICLVFGAIVRSGITLKGSLEIHGALHSLVFAEKSDSRTAGKGTPAKTFNEQQIPELKQAFAELKELTFHPYYLHDRNDTELSLKWMRPFVSMWSNVETLKFGGPQRDTWRYTEPLARVGLCSDRNAFPRLRHLVLEAIDFDRRALWQSVTESETLETLQVLRCERLEYNEQLACFAALRQARSLYMFAYQEDVLMKIKGDTHSDFVESLDIVTSLVESDEGDQILIAPIREHVKAGRIHWPGVVDDFMVDDEGIMDYGGLEYENPTYEWEDMEDEDLEAEDLEDEDLEDEDLEDEDLEDEDLEDEDLEDEDLEDEDDEA